ncbi:MAG: helix-turn-helix domain-containing protein [Candidatus Gastranaerophilales bacterium]|nr:helix-turn-helix domain-containing protein [Candidatus Gastranaerophilales bacterium]
MDKKKLLGKRIQEFRKRKNIKQETLAEMVCVEPASISNIENGRNYPSFATLEKIIQVLDITFIEVFEFEQHQPKEDLMKEIYLLLTNNPDKIQDVYKIVKALIE